MSPTPLRRPDLDTIIVPAKEDGFNAVFIAQNRWHAVRLSKSLIPQIKYIAAYRVAPISAITHIAKVKQVLPFNNTRKYLIEFDGPAEAISPIPFLPKMNSTRVRSVRYTSRQRLRVARNLTDIWR
jgi:hypothetical protein